MSGNRERVNQQAIELVSMVGDDLAREFKRMAATTAHNEVAENEVALLMATAYNRGLDDMAEYYDGRRAARHVTAGGGVLAAGGDIHTGR